MNFPLFLGHDDVINNLSTEILFQRLEKGFVDYTNNKIIQPLRMVLNIKEGDIFLVKPVVSITEDCIATKLMTVFPGNQAKYNKPTHNGIVVLYDCTTGTLQGVLDAPAITYQRTAVATAVAIKHLSKQNNGILAIIGTGNQGKSHITVLKELFHFKEIRVYSRKKETRERFALEMNVISSDSVEEAVNNADVIVTVTTATSPVLFKNWVKEGALVNVVGAQGPHEREVDDNLLETSQIIADSEEESYKSGDIIASKVKIECELGDIIQGKSEVDWKRIRIFKSCGLAVQDLIAGKIVVESVLNAQNSLS